MLFLLYLLSIPLALFSSLENVHFMVCSKFRVQTELPFAFHLALESENYGREDGCPYNKDVCCAIVKGKQRAALEK